MFLESDSEVPTSLADVYLATFTRNPVDAWLVLVCLEQSLNLVGGSVKDFDVMVKKDMLDLMGGFPYVGEGDGTNVPIRLTLDIGVPLVVGGFRVLRLDLVWLVSLLL